MTTDEGFVPEIDSPYVAMNSSANEESYLQLIRNTVKRILPPTLRLKKTDDPEAIEDFKEQLHASLPILTCTPGETVPCYLSLCLLFKFRPNGSKFFFEMISNWLVPGQRLNDVLFYAVDFTMPTMGKDLYTLCEIILHITDPAEFEQVIRNLPMLESEIRLGVQSAYYARRILEVRGIAASEKTALVLEYLAYLIKRMPGYFDYDLFTEMQHVLVMCSDEFKESRKSRHLSRIIAIHYHFRKALREALKIAPDRRHLNLKLFKTKFMDSDEPRKCLGVIVGINFLGDKEVFEEKHVLKAIQNYLPNVQTVEGSFFANRHGDENLCTLYLEIEKSDRTDFTSEEILRLRNELPTDLKDRIEHLMHPIFMPRNEEEVMRNILSLSNQLKYLKDTPQVFITFDEQTPAGLFFTIIMVRILKSHQDLSVQELFQRANTFLEYIHDWKKNVGYVRKKYPKEANVFRVKLPKQMFLREDHSLDLYKARQMVVSELVQIVGEVRDFNGGMISKQNELLYSLRNLLAEHGTFQDFLLENFFYSLRPAIMRTVLEASILKTLFIMMLETLEKGISAGAHYSLHFQRELEIVYVMVLVHQSNLKEKIDATLATLNVPATELASAFVSTYDISCIGYIYCCDDPYKQDHFCQLIYHTCEAESKQAVF